MDAHPVRANGMGGRAGPHRARATATSGTTTAIEFEYADGVRHFCQARQQPGTWSHVSDNVHGTKGSLTLGTGAWGMGTLTPRELRAKGYPGDNPYQQEHDDLMASIRGTGPYLLRGRLRGHQQHDGRDGPHGHLLRPDGHLGRGDRSRSCGSAPARYALDADPPTLPDERGNYPVAMPGVR